MKRKMACVAAGLAATALLVGAAGSADATITAGPQTLWLNSYSPTVVDGGSEAQAGFQLAAGETYKINVQGTFSAWGQWPYLRCGDSDPSAVYASPGRANVPVGDDAVFRFAEPLYGGRCPRMKFPYARNDFQLNLGTAWKSFVPNGGIPKRPAGGTHSYTETVVGTGAAPSFRIADWDPADNSGELKITITEITPPTPA